MTRRSLLGLLFPGAAFGQHLLSEDWLYWRRRGLHAPMTLFGSAYRYYIDAALGSDSNDGSRTAPWQSLSKIDASILAAGQAKTVLIKAGTYDKATDYFDIQNNSSAGATLSVAFEPGCTLNGATAATTLIKAGGSAAWTFTIKGNGLSVNQSAGSQAFTQLGTNTTSLFEDVYFVPHTTNGNVLDVTKATYRRCRVGTLSARSIVSSTVAGAFEDCYLNVYIDGNSFVDMTGSYGKLTTRMRNGGSVTANHCCFVGPASGQTDSALFRNFDPGSQGTWEFQNTVLKGYNVALGRTFGATDAGYFVAAGNFATYMCLFGNATAIDPDLESAAGSSVTTGLVTSDPLLGAANTYVKADYAIGALSPCRGAGSSGSDIGFRA